MKQVTGSSTPQTANKVSIQQSLDGHSFSAPMLGGNTAGEGAIEVEVLSARTALVPRELFDDTAAEAVLTANGMYPANDECVVWSDTGREIVAVMTLAKEAAAAVTQKFGERATYTTPLLHEPDTTAPTVWCSRMAGLLYIKVYDKGLLFAEVVPAATDADVVYLFERLNGVFTLKNYHLETSGNDDKALRKLLRNRFK